MSVQLMSRAEELLEDVLADLPDAKPGVSRWGDVCLRVRERTVATLEDHKHGPCLVVKVPKAELPALLESGPYSLAPYVGRYGWVCVRLSSDTDWDQVREMVIESYRLVAQSR
jgi:predicted DNA-binding protein (MmcQ/YjbR family)